MQLSDIYPALGEAGFAQLLREVSIGKLKTYQMYERLKVRLHLAKLNTESLRRAAPRLLVRLSEGDEELAGELAQAVLVGHLDMVVAVLDFLGVPHQEGFFAKDIDASAQLTGDWQARTYGRFKDEYPPVVLAFYLNHLEFELGGADELFTPAAA